MSGVLQIQKKDGSSQDYDRRKLLTSLIRAQATPEQAMRVATDIETWLVSQNIQVVKSDDIKARIMEDLNKINPDAAHAYEVYKKAVAEAQK
ncbi:hypothetical protein A2V56_01450 [Candidatus Woesebacteria bacterium RBG_19FT_COMBO_42_9]|uniref:ATP-cone domain-containing protein n=1 Tax=Candidatus Woesebacteria bacterium RBG_16_42_24 TaxID=1802485 RepID=A0A1F7XM09_9BACT|nr:MAG: hypothetical protein A2V97_04660 [Candidatus Woesebacteria bacterium RBG_16_42_24]OGM17930.1 MAG: hypothetical protein A2V56_01450 [Candidatus Woesebacteria bacterium RBG_19FT_COMBO_42_9]